MTENAVQLACEQCKKRKSRCNKQFPCSACNDAGLECRPVQRARLPRGRTGKIKKRNAALEDKVARLEILLQKVEAQVAQNEEAIDPTNGLIADVEVPPGAQRVQYANKVEHFVARDFWSSLASEVSGLRETLEQSDEDDAEIDTPSLAVTADSRLPSPQYSLLFQYNNGASVDTPISDLPISVRRTLLDLYKTRVDVLFKVLHWPTFLSMISDQHVPTSGPAIALEKAVYFLALCSATPEECIHLRLGDRSLLLEQARSVTEVSLSNANLLTTSNVTVLQAFTLYLAAIRCCISAASTWTLLALAIRIADACGVGSENIQKVSSFEFEIRRRLWFSIGLLDSQTAFGRGSLPLLSHRDLATPPLSINDSEMSMQNVQTVSESSFTDMTFSALCHHSMICQRKLCDPSIANWQDRVDIVAGFELFVNRNFGQFEFSSDPLQRYTAIGARDMSASMNLLLRRPPYKHVADPVPESDNFDVLGMGCRVLQSGLFKRKTEDFAPFSWFSWPKWYALAVVLVELLNHRSGPGHDYAFATAQQSYADYAQSATDAHSSLLWKPITKLMRRVERIQNQPVASTTNSALRFESSAPQSSHQRHSYDQPSSVTASLGNLDETIVQPSIPRDKYGFIGNVGYMSWVGWDDFLDDITHNTNMI